MNDAEAQFVTWAASEGWVATKQGWPDFICRRGDEVMAVEVKWSDGLSQYQEDACLMLAAHGVPVFVWTPGRALRPFAVTAKPDAQSVLRLSEEVAHLRDQNEALRLELAIEQTKWANVLSQADARERQMRFEIRYLIRVAERTKNRTNRLLAIFRRHPEDLVGIRPGLRSSLPISLPTDDDAEDQAVA